MAIFGLNNALIGLVGLIIMEIFPVQLISAFAPSEEMFAIGITALRILGLSFVFGGISVMTCYDLLCITGIFKRNIQSFNFYIKTGYYFTSAGIDSWKKDCN